MGRYPPVQFICPIITDDKPQTGSRASPSMRSTQRHKGIRDRVDSSFSFIVLTILIIPHLDIAAHTMCKHLRRRLRVINWQIVL